MRGQTDVLITGAGLSGLTLAVSLLRDGPPDLSIQIVDPCFTPRKDRTWCFWGAVPKLLEPLVDQTWRRMRVAGPQAEVSDELHRNPYHLVRGETFGRAMLAELVQSPRVRLRRGAVRGVADGEEGAHVDLEEGRLHARWVFRSHPWPRRRGGLLQHFGGWEIECEQPQFDPSAVTLMDFDTGTSDGIDFTYVLPMSPHQALVEHTVISSRPLASDAYDAAVQAYLDRHVRGRWRRLRSEYGVIGMDPDLPPQRSGRHLFNIGSAGGMTKPSTGYTLRRILRQSEHLTRTWATEGAPQPLPLGGARHRFLDRIFLRVLERRPELGAEIFYRIFAQNRFDDVLDFLEERSSWTQELAIVSSLPVGPFLSAAVYPPRGRAAPLEART